MDTLTNRLRSDLSRAMKAKDRTTVSVLRTTLAAFANAEAPPMTNANTAPVVGELVQHPRLIISEDDRVQIVQDEIEDRQHTISLYEAANRLREASELREEISILQSYLH